MSGSVLEMVVACSRTGEFTHVSFDDFRIVRDNLAGGNRTTPDRLVSYCMFTGSTFARVGLNEGDARRQTGLHAGACRRARRPIPGFTMIGAEAGEVMAVVQAVLAHPTMADGLGSLFSNVPPP